MHCKEAASILNSVANFGGVFASKGYPFKNIFIVLTLFYFDGKIWDSSFCVLSDHKSTFLNDSVFYLFCLFETYCPSQQLWSCWDGHFT